MNEGGSSPPNSILLSIITLSYHRANTLLQKLEALKNSNLDPQTFEIVIGFNDSDTKLIQTIEALTLPYQIKLLAFETNQGISKGRNLCIEATKGKIIYFSDDDCIPNQDTLNQHIKAQEKEQAVYIGSILFKDGNTESSWIPKKVNYGNTNGANTSVPKQAIQAIDGFDESLSGYGGEDILLGYQLKKLGLNFLALQDTWTTHIGPDPALSRNKDKAYSAGYNAVMIAKKLPASVALRLGVHPLLLGLKKIILNPLVMALFKNSASLLYEKAYLTGALDAKHNKTKRQ